MRYPGTAAPKRAGRRSPVAQLAERPTVNRQVAGSSPAGGAIPGLQAPYRSLVHTLCIQNPLSGDAYGPPAAAARNVRSHWLRDPSQRRDPGPRQIPRPRRSSTASVPFGVQPAPPPSVPSSPTGDPSDARGREGLLWSVRSGNDLSGDYPGVVADSE